MKNLLSIFTTSMLILSLNSCSLLLNKFNGIDYIPPQILQAHSLGSKVVNLELSEELDLESVLMEVQPKLDFNLELSANKKGLNLLFKKDQVAGQEYLYHGSIADKSSNTLSFVIKLYGFNPNKAELLINEFNPEGSNAGNNPELVEFFVLKSGSLGGLSFFQGLKDELNKYFIFPDVQVQSGDFVLLHTRFDKDRDQGYLSELSKKNASKGRLASDNAWDFWAPNFGGLSATNAVLSLYDSPTGSLLDAVIYTTYLSSDKYRGWKTRANMNRVDAIAELDAWTYRDLQLQPEDAIQSLDSTGTRSINRIFADESPLDTNSSSDWYIVATSKSSFGKANSLDLYVPKAAKF